jgi:hypothetical protein
VGDDNIARAHRTARTDPDQVAGRGQFEWSSIEDASLADHCLIVAMPKVEVKFISHQSVASFWNCSIAGKE